MSAPVKSVIIVEVPERFYFKVAGAACYLGIGKNTLRAYTDMGLIQARRLPGGDRLYCKDDLDGFVRALPDAIEQRKPVGRHANQVLSFPSDLSGTPGEGGE